jgi:hypothetical protein
LSQVTGALDQIAGHKKQVRLATEREETLKDNVEYQEQKEFRKTEDTIYNKYGKYFTEDDAKIDELKTNYGIGTDQEDRRGYYRDLNIHGQSFVDKEKTAEETRKTEATQAKRKNTLESKTGKEVEFDESIGDFVIYDDVNKEFIDADRYVGLNREKTAKGKSDKPSVERAKLEKWFSENDIAPQNTGILSMQEQRKSVMSLKSDIESFDKDPNVKKLLTDTEKIDNVLYREKSRDFMLKGSKVKRFLRTKEGIDESLAQAISDSGGEYKMVDGKYYERVRVEDVEDDFGLTQSQSQKLLDRIATQDDKVKELESMSGDKGAYTEQQESLINKFMEANEAIKTREEAIKILKDNGRL